LQNFIERAVVLLPGPVLRPTLPELKHMTKQPSATSARTLAEAEWEHILDVLKQTDWLIGGSHGAAARLGLPRTTLVYKMRKLGIEARRPQRVWSSGHEMPVLAPGGIGAGRFEAVAAF
jgi:formate hydrogenlyase transcriptional activator